VSNLVVLSAGAAKGLVEALAPGFLGDTGVGVSGTFGAVGAIRAKFLERGPCDVLILTAPMLDALAADGEVVRETIAPLGDVLTGVAVRTGDPLPRIDTPDALREAFAAMQRWYCPDTKQATAGIHFAKVLDTLGLAHHSASRVREYPSGAVAMRALADDPDPGAIGCTQVTEILYTPGVTLVGPLPAAFTLATTYSVAVASRSAQPALARRFVATLTSPAQAALRVQGGFVPREAR
jgi:molybdate transport system substrate-binding protein